MKDKRNKYLLEHASSEEDIAILNTKLIDFIIEDKGIDPRMVERLTAQVLLVCRSFDNSLELVSNALATALYLVFTQSTSMCMVEKIEPFVKKLN